MAIHSADVQRSRRERGLCCSCSQPALPGKARCQYHTDVAKQKDHEKYLRRKQTGLCVTTGCTQPAGVDSVYCDLCLIKQRNRQIMTAAELAVQSQAIKETESAERLAQGICIECGAFYIDAEQDRCRYCYALQLERIEDIPRYNARLRAGLCQSCPAYVEPGTVRCDQCREVRRQKTAERQQAGKCTQCDKPTNGVNRYCDDCREEDKNDYANRKDKGICVAQHCDQLAVEDKTMCERHLIMSRKKSNRKHDRLRAEIIEAYGSKCSCPGCPETLPQFLEIDHIDGKGADDRRAHGSGGLRLYRRLKAAGFPKDNWQLLCSNCNKAKHIYGQCPHVTAQAVAT